MISRSLRWRFESLDLNSVFSPFLLGSTEAVTVPNDAETGNHGAGLNDLIKLSYSDNLFS